jgi:hypothetical protein
VHRVPDALLGGGILAHSGISSARPEQV